MVKKVLSQNERQLKFIVLKKLPYPSHRRRGSFLFALYLKSSRSKPGGKIHVYKHF